MDRLPPEEVLAEIESKVDLGHPESTLMAEGIKKFANPQKVLLALVAERSSPIVINQETG